MPTRDHKAAYARRNALAKQRGFRSYAEQRRFGRDPKNQADYAALPEFARGRRSDALDVLDTARRDKLTVEEAARRRGLPVAAVTWWAEPALEPRKAGAVRPKRGDRLLRVTPLIVEGEVTFVTTRGSKAAATAQAAYRAQRESLEGKPGATAALARFNGVRVGGRLIETDRDVINEIGRRGELEDLAEMYRAWVS